MRGLDVGFQRGAEARGEPLRWEASHGRGEDQGERTAAMRLLLTGDGQFLEVTASVQYADRRDPARTRSAGSSWDSTDPEASASGPGRVGRAEGRVAAEAGRPADQRPARGGGGRDPASSGSRLARLDLGVCVQGITFQDVHPPLAVVDAYRDVSRAESDRQRRVNEADGLPGREADRGGGPGQGHRERRPGRARAAARPGLERRRTSFAYQLAARQAAPSLTDFRLFWETIAEVSPASPS